MAKRKSTKPTEPAATTAAPARLAMLIIERPALRIPEHTPLDATEMARLREILNDPVYVKAWANAQLSKPGVMLDTTGQHGPQAAAHRLHEIRGWELHHAALLSQTRPRATRAPIVETFQSE